jgi:hypothetical protein
MRARGNINTKGVHALERTNIKNITDVCVKKKGEWFFETERVCVMTEEI